MERPGMSLLEIAGSNDVEGFGWIVHIILHHVGRPNHAIGMEGRIIGLAARKGEASIGLNARTSTQSRVDGGPVTERARPAKYGRGPNLHDVRFAAQRPGQPAYVSAEARTAQLRAFARGT